MAHNVSKLKTAFETKTDFKFASLRIRMSGISTQFTRMLFETKSKLNLTDIRIYLNLLNRCSCKRGVFYSFPSYASLSSQLEIKNNQICKSIKKLTEYGMILILKRISANCGRPNNVYVIMDLTTQIEHDTVYVESLSEQFTLQESVALISKKYKSQKVKFLSLKKSMVDDLNKRSITFSESKKAKNVPEKTPPE